MIAIPKNKEDVTEEWLSNLENSEIGEIDWIDFKRKDTDKLGSCITSFLNKETGGVIIIGLEKINKIFEFEPNVGYQKIIDEKISKYIGLITDPPTDLIDFGEIEYKTHPLLVIFVKSGQKFPYFYNGIIYLRSGSDSVPIKDKRQIMALLSYEIGINKAIRILKNDIKLIKHDCDSITKAIKEISKGVGSTETLRLFPKNIDDSRIRDIFLVLEPYLLEKDLLEVYHTILDKIGFINLRLDILKTSEHTRYGCEKVFGSVPSDLLELLVKFEERL